ncbi:MAG: PAS domain-containing protein [Gemmatimonadaceae bacterium]|nr:PAS domain-containing protein [Gemmatimonadaceae bacterium]
MPASRESPPARRRRRVSPLRLRLLAIVAIAFLPIFMLVVRLTDDERRAIYQRERLTALRLLDVALTEHRNLVRAGRELLRQLSQLPEVSRGSPATCSGALRDLLATYADFTSATRITTDLRMDCSAVAFPDSLADVRQVPSVQRVAGTGRPVTNWFRVGRLGQPLASIIEPIRDTRGRVAFYLNVEAELNWFTNLVRTIPVDPGAIAALVESTGLIIARQPDPEGLAGLRHEPNEVLRAMIGEDSGFVEGVGLDGRERLYAFREIPADNDAQILLMIGLPTELVYADANRHLRTNVMLAIVMLGLTLLMAWVGAELFVLRDVKALLGATERLADGDLSSRARLQSSHGELNDLAARFNDLAQRLEERRREFVVLGDASQDAIARLTSDLTVEWVNTVALQRLGQSLDDVAGVSLLDLPVDQDVLRATAELARGALATGRSREQEIRLTGPPGESWFEVRAVPDRNAAGDTTHVMIMARDVTERRQLALHLAQADRMDSIGQLAGHIAHDFNNLLTAIIGNAEIALRQMEPTDRATSDVQKILDVSRRASSLTRQLLSFARRQSFVSRVLNLGTFIEEATPLLRRVVGDQVRLELDLARDTPCVRFDPTQLEQVLVNLAANARDAMPEGGTMTITTRRHTVPDAGLTPGNLDPGEYVVLAVTDTGIGMPGHVRARIFEPFFTTKHGRGGTGLGLPVVYGAVRQHDGTIEVESVEHHGATFRITLPATTAPADSRETPPWTPEAPRGRETILLAEDQDDVRATIARLLRAHGYAVIDTGDGAEILGLLERRELPPFQLLITDLLMPRVGGEALVEALRPAFPEVPILVISGFDQQGSLKRMFEHGRASAFLEKPFEAAPLLRVVRELLDTQAARERRGELRVGRSEL